MAASKLLEYFPFSSSVNPSFWNKLTEIKLDIDKLEESGKHIWGYYSNFVINNCGTPLFEVDSTSYNNEFSNSNVCLPCHGILLNKNTVEQFKECDKNLIIQKEGRKIWDCITNGEVDLKKYHYYYWFCFPSLPKITVELSKIEKLKTLLNLDLITKLTRYYYQLNQHQKPFFVVKYTSSGIEVLPLKSVTELNGNTNYDNYYFAFADPCVSTEHPGWPLRNFIGFLLHTCPCLRGRKINFLAFRLNREENEIRCSNSLIFTVILPSINVEDIVENVWIGWERNERGKFGPRLANMRNSIDPTCLAEAAVDLNLKLMKWRLLPQINLDIIKSSKCLLLGSGTLGCSVARTLLGWGVRSITFVDNACVSMSNPVRQSLYTFEDCCKNKPKAEAAAKALKHIFPGVISEGFNFSIPMPGHPVGDSLLLQTKENVQTLCKLISEHHIVFLLMDSRESRWLPTVLGSYYKKLIINAALGFDTYLIMRHGFNSIDLEEVSGTSCGSMKAIPGNRLGCYFCNDVTAPGNSIKNRTLDQKCTVARPGLSLIAGALAVELAVSVLQHPKGALAPAYYKSNNQELGGDIGPEESILGVLPHSIRGFLSTYNQVLPATEKYKQCVACSDIIMHEYHKNDFQFILQVLNSSKYLEEVTGLSKMQNEITDLEVWDLEDDEESL